MSTDAINAEVWDALVKLDVANVTTTSESQLDQSAQDRVNALAKLPALEYGQARAAAAKAIGLPASQLDKAVKEIQRANSRDSGNAGAAVTLTEVNPWNAPVDGAELLESIHAIIKRHVVCDVETARAAALWIVFTWLIDEVNVAPIAMITAPEKRCGKTVLLSLFNRLCAKPLSAANISAAAIFRCVEAWKPTLLIDEADAFLRDNENARGILNSGHTRDTAYVIRVVGEDLEPRRFSTWGAKAIAGIGKLADTLTDRSIALELRRKLPGEQVEKLRHADADVFSVLRRKLARWTQDQALAVRTARPVPVDSINDRAQDNWEPLLAIADTAGGGWPELARKAAIKISGAEQDTLSITAELLADIQAAFASKGTDRMTTADLIAALCDDEESPWPTWNRGKPITAKQLAGKLRDFKVISQTVRFGRGPSDTAKGYLLADFRDAFTRYLAPDTPVLPSQRHTPSATQVPADFASVTEDGLCRDENICKPSNHAGCDGVTGEIPESGTDIEEIEL